MSPLNVETSTSAPWPAGSRRSTEPLTVSMERSAPPGQGAVEGHVARDGLHPHAVEGGPADLQGPVDGGGLDAALRALDGDRPVHRLRPDAGAAAHADAGAHGLGLHLVGAGDRDRAVDRLRPHLGGHAGDRDLRAEGLDLQPAARGHVDLEVAAHAVGVHALGLDLDLRCGPALPRGSRPRRRVRGCR